MYCDNDSIRFYSECFKQLPHLIRHKNTMDNCYYFLPYILDKQTKAHIYY